MGRQHTQGQMQKDNTGKKRTIRFIRGALLLIIIGCLIPIGHEWYLSIKNHVQQDEIKNLLHTEDENHMQQEDGKSSGDILEDLSSEKPQISDKYKELYKKNSDLAGWISVEGMDIDYPVMQCEDDNYYLSHNFYKEESKYGCLYVRNIADINTPGTNFIIYGHNMKDGSMFGELDQYKDKDFYKEHSWISFDTLYEERTYRIMAVFQIQIYDEKEPFQYYQFYQADKEEDFLYFYENVMERAIYDTGVTAEYGDTFLTLSTCDSYGEDSRLVVVAKLEIK